MYEGGSDFQSEVYANAPNISMMNTMYTPTFGTGNFVIQQPSPGEVSDGFPSVPYMSLEALLYQSQSSNPLSSPVNTLSGSNTGQQVIAGQYTMQDSTQTSRYQMGFQSNNQ